MRFKKRYVFIPLTIAAVALICVFVYRDQQKITGEEWLSAQSIYVDELSEYADSMDTVFTLYISGSISSDDFLNHISILKDELAIMVADREATADDYPVKTGTHTYSSKKGCEAIDDCYTVLCEILDMAYANYGDTDASSYKYLAYHQTIIDDLANYMAAVEITEAGQEENDE